MLGLQAVQLAFCANLLEGILTFHRPYMRRIVLFCLPVLFWGLNFPLHAAVYKEVDSRGNVTYTDQPEPNAKPVDLKSGDLGTTGTAPSPATGNTGNASTDSASQSSSKKPVRTASPRVPSPAISPALTQKKPPMYHMSLVSPAEKQTFQNGQDVVVTVAITPALEGDDTVVVYVDGALATEPSNATSITVPRLDRGEHTVQARIIQPNGSGAETQIVTIYQQRTSVLLPPNRPPGI